MDESNRNVQFIDMPEPDYALIARQLVRTLRGRRSQQHLSRRLGYRSNALYTWEAGSAFPPATRLFHLAERVGVDLPAGLRRFFRDVPPQLRSEALVEPEGLQALLVELRGRTRIGDLARRSGFSRFTLSRWLHGSALPDIAELLCYVEHASLRLLDFLEIFVDPAALPAVAEPWAALQAARRLGYHEPATHAVLRALETEAYRVSPSIASLARLTGLPGATIRVHLQALVDSGQVVRRGRAYVPDRVQAVDFRRDPAAAQDVKAFWARLAAERTAQPRRGLFAYNVFAVSRSDLERLQELQRAYLKEMRTIIADSAPSEVVALANIQIFSLGD